MKTTSKVLLFLLVSFVIVSLNSSVFAAGGGGTPKYPWNIPNNVRIVQKDTTDNVRIFSTITGALNSITGASSTNRYIVKVMPGIYNEPVTMKSYVDIVGSGQENTVITSSSSTTVTVANNTALRNIQITNSYVSGKRTGLLLNNVLASLENIAVELLSSSVNQYAIDISGTSVVDINNINVKVVAGAGNQYYGIWTRSGAQVSISNSHLTVYGNGGNNEVAALSAWGGVATVITVRNSVLETFNAWDQYTVESESGVIIKIVGSSITASNIYASHVTAAVGKWGSGAIEILNSEVRAENVNFPESVHTFWSNGTAKVSASLIQGAFDLPITIVNCWDENFNPIPNQ